MKTTAIKALADLYRVFQISKREMDLRILFMDEFGNIDYTALDEARKLSTETAFVSKWASTEKDKKTLAKDLQAFLILRGGK